MPIACVPQVTAFLERHPDFTQEPIEPASLAHLGGTEVQAVVTKDGSIATFPHRHGVLDGSFAARLRRLA